MLEKPEEEARTHCRDGAEPKIILWLINVVQKFLPFPHFLDVSKSLKLGHWSTRHNLF